MKRTILKFSFIALSVLMVMSCHDDLDQLPIDPDSVTEQDVFANANQAKGALAKLYASLALTGQQGPAGQPDISGIDEGFSQYTRMLYNLNELTTDHAVVGWGDPGLPDLHGMSWSSNNDFTEAMYYRLAQEVSFTNSFISNATLLTDPVVEQYIAEARFLRAFAYYNLMDLYGSVPLSTEISTDLPEQATRSEIFDFVEQELLDIQNTLGNDGSVEYGRVDEVAAWALLSKLYLNAEVFKGEARYNEAVEFSEKVINSTYSINTNDANGNGSAYDELFLADNNVNGAQNEFIFTLNFDGLQSQTFGGTTFLTHASIGGNMDALEYGVNSGWAGLRTTKSLVNKFDNSDEELNESFTTLSDWAIIGDATPNEWSAPDTDMYEVEANIYQLFVTLTDGQMKFRKDNSWDVNYGGTDGVLELNSSTNINVDAGRYLVTLDLTNDTYSLESIYNYLPDARAMFYTDGQSLEIEDIPPFEQGFAVTKFKNIDSNGNQGSDNTGNFVDTDYPVIRLPEIYLNYAEATLRGGNGNQATAISLINEIRERAYGNTNANITGSDLTLEFILDERSRELYWEGQRRTDLIRYNLFTTDGYLWPFKGDVQNGVSVPEYRTLFPIPNDLLSINPNLRQNEGY
ncbi:RagB/SusD family nutrient uptake outer membrane protein [Psychroflexus salinarum]|uniref:RagB/SusD family nutrient uptake outer membrane protein n=1 Tax=Psychroflexus salinarum TaxID=546024 RepID=A0ABW3GRR2_9FLAO